MKDQLVLFESSQRHAQVYKAKNRKWYLELAHNEYGEQEDADLYGPFASMKDAEDYVRNFENPGGVMLDSRTLPTPKRAPNYSKIKKPSSQSGGLYHSEDPSDADALAEAKKTKPPGFREASKREEAKGQMCASCAHFDAKNEKCIKFNWPVDADDMCDAFVRAVGESLAEAVTEKTVRVGRFYGLKSSASASDWTHIVFVTGRQANKSPRGVVYDVDRNKASKASLRGYNFTGAAALSPKELDGGTKANIARKLDGKSFEDFTESVLDVDAALEGQDVGLACRILADELDEVTRSGSVGGFSKAFLGKAGFSRGGPGGGPPLNSPFNLKSKKDAPKPPVDVAESTARKFKLVGPNKAVYYLEIGDNGKGHFIDKTRLPFSPSNFYFTNKGDAADRKQFNADVKKWASMPAAKAKRELQGRVDRKGYAVTVVESVAEAVAPKGGGGVPIYASDRKTVVAYATKQMTSIGAAKKAGVSAVSQERVGGRLAWVVKESVGEAKTKAPSVAFLRLRSGKPGAGTEMMIRKHGGRMGSVDGHSLPVHFTKEANR
jgi:hypothetical protein